MLEQIIKELRNYIENKTVKTSSFPFKVITRFTVNILAIFVVIISLKQYFGDPINCVTESKYKDAFELKCWIEGTYIMRSLLNATREKTISYGVGSAGARTLPSDYIHQKHYQWVVPVLSLQALLFYIPRVFWHSLENGLMQKLLGKSDAPTITEDWGDQKMNIIKFLREFSRRFHRFYLLKYVFCELLAGISLVFNVFIMQWVFSFWSEFRPAIAALLRQDFDTFAMYSSVLFPVEAKCSFNTFGYSGSITHFDALCFLPQNVINEKVFVFLYFWFILLCIITLFNFISIFSMLTFRFLRIGDLRRMSQHFYNRRQNSFFNYYSDVGYWFVLRLLHKNLSPVLYKDLINDMMYTGEKLNNNHSFVEIDEKVDEENQSLPEYHMNSERMEKSHKSLN